MTRRRKERGSVIFIVGMTLAILGTLGAYALVNTSNDVKVSGFSRQRSQTQMVSEYGIIGASQAVNGATAQMVVGLMTDPTKKDTKCVSLPDPGTTSSSMAPKHCRRIGATELGLQWSSPVFNSSGTQGTTTQTALGPYPIQTDFFVEFTDPVDIAPPAGMDLRLGFCYTQLTASAIGVIRPDPKGATAATTGGADPVYSNQAVQTARARLIAGPIRCSK